MPRVRFLEERIIQDEHRHDPSRQTIMRVGEIYDLSDDSYVHWLTRAPLELVVDLPPKPQPTAALIAPAPSLPPPAPVFSSFTDQPGTAAIGEYPPEQPPEEPPIAAIDKSAPKGGGKPKG